MRARLFAPLISLASLPLFLFLPSQALADEGLVFFGELRQDRFCMRDPLLESLSTASNELALAAVAQARETALRGQTRSSADHPSHGFGDAVAEKQRHSPIFAVAAYGLKLRNWTRLA